MGKVKAWLHKMLPKLMGRKGGAAKGFALLYTLLAILCILLYIVMTLSDWYITGHGDRPELRLFVSTLLGAGAVGGVLGIGKMLVDKNKNGIPDVMEDEEDKK